MIVIHALDGTQVAIDENAVVLIAGPYPHDLGPHTYVHGVDRGVLVTSEEASALAARLRINPPLAKLTRPDSTPVWIKGAAVTEIRPSAPTDQLDSGNVRAVVVVGGLRQAVRENFDAATKLLGALAAKV
jgi:hypothetical protein